MKAKLESRFGLVVFAMLFWAACGGEATKEKVPPVTEASPVGGAYSSIQSIALTCDDGQGSGCAATYYCLDATEPTTDSSVYSAPVSVSSEGATTLKYFSVDKAGNQEAVQTQVYTLDLTPPRVQSTHPLDQADDQQADLVVRVVFSEPMDPGSVDDKALWIEGIAGQVTYDPGNQTATCTPTVPLAYKSSYTAVVSKAATDLVGHPLAEEIRWVFTVGDLPAAHRLPHGTGLAEVDEPQVVFNAAGDGLAVWEVWSNRSSAGSAPRGVGSPKLVYAHFDANSASWTEPAMMAVQPPFYSRQSFYAHLATNGVGFAVIWSQGVGTSGIQLHARIHDGSQWGQTALLNDQPIKAGFWPATVASAGNHYLVSWIQRDQNIRHLYARAFEGGAWGPIIEVNSRGGDQKRIWPQYALAAGGDGYGMLWIEIYLNPANNQPEKQLYASVYQSGKFAEPSLLVAVADGYLLPPDMRMVASGAGYMAAWKERDQDGSCDVYTSVHNGSQWSRPMVLSDNTRETGDGGLTLSSNGDGVAVAWWYIDEVENTLTPWARVYTGGSWQDEVRLDSNGIGNLYSAEPVQLAKYLDGYVALWRQANADNLAQLNLRVYTEGVWSNNIEYVDSATWSIDVLSHQLASNDTNFAVVWTQRNQGDLYARVYSSGQLGPSVLIGDGGRQVRDRMLVSIEDGVDEGFAVAFVQARADRNTAVYLNRYKGGWLGPEEMSSAGTGSDISVQLVGNDAGDLLAIWRQVNGDSLLYACIYRDGLWGEPFLLDTRNCKYHSCRHQADAVASGQGFAVVWEKHQREILLASHDGTDWSPTLKLQESNPDIYVDKPHMVSNGNGYAVVWLRYAALGTQVSRAVMARVHDGEDLGPPVELNDPGLPVESVVDSLRVAANSQGYAVVWVQAHADPAYCDVFANVYTGGSWKGAVALSDTSKDQVDNDEPILAASQGGYAVVWNQDQDEEGSKLMGRVFDGAAWGDLAVFRDLDKIDTSYRLASDDQGYALVWLGGHKLEDVLVSLYQDGAWTDPTIVDSLQGETARLPVVAASDAGYAVVWEQAKRVYAVVSQPEGWTQAVALGDVGIKVLRLVPRAAGFALIWGQTFGNLWWNSPYYQQLFASEYDGSWWSQPHRLDPGASAVSPVVYGHGRTVSVVWTQHDLSADPGVGYLWSVVNY